MTKTKILREIDFTIGNYVIIVRLEYCIKDLWVGLYWENEYCAKAIPNKDIDAKERWTIIDDTILMIESISEICLRLLDLYFIYIPTLTLHFIICERIERTFMDDKREYIKRYKDSHGKIGDKTNV